MATFELYVNRLLALEGGYSSDKFDRGGATNMGVTLSTWRGVGYDQVFEHRLRFIKQIVRNDPSQSRFEKGWINRLNQFKYQ
jgi:lysozyme family protein